MSLNNADAIFLAVGLIDFAGLFVWIGVCLHIACTKMELMLGYLKNSPILGTLTPLKYRGLWGKLVLVGSISSVLAFPRFYLKRSSVSTVDLHNFPVSLKRRLVILQWVGIVLLLTMVCLAAVAKFDLV